jgi:CubicO group peptidase (beta-lactamase class C family)
MHPSKFTIAFLLAVFASSLPSPFVSADTQKNLEEFLRRADAYGFTGAVLVGKGDEILFQGAVGFANHETGLRPAEDTAYSVGSITKQFTAAAILHLESEGKLHTDDPVSKHLDFIPEDKKGVTLHHLLTHTSGVADYYWDQFPALSWDEYVKEQINKVKLRGTPGEQYAYSNFGYHLLATVIQEVTGQPYETFLVENLFKPLGMDHTGFNEPDWKPGQVAQYQDWTTQSSTIRVQDPLSRPVYLQPEGSGEILSTVGDLFKWHRALKKNTLLSKEATEKMFTPHLQNYGYGWYVSKTTRGTKLIEHGGYDTWLGTLAGFYRYVNEDIVIIVLANSTISRTLQHAYFVKQIENIIFEEPYALPPKPVAINAVEVAAYTGTYALAPDEAINISSHNNRLRLATQSPTAIRTLIFPNSADPVKKRNKTPETEAEKLVDAFHAGDLKRISEDLDPRIDQERFARRWKGSIARLERDKGKLQSIREVHALDFEHAGNPETQHFVHLKFAKGDELLRLIRANDKWLGARIYPLPNRLEIPLAPTGPDTFQNWDFRHNSGAQISFTKDTIQLHGKNSSTTAQRVD